MKLKALTIALMLAAAWVSPAGAVLNDDNPNTALYADHFVGPDGTDEPTAWVGGVGVDFDGYVGARPGDTFVIHMLSNNMDGWPQVGSYRTAFWYDYNITTRGIERTDWSDTAGTFSNGPYVTNYTGYTMIDRYHGMGSQASIYTGLCIVSWEFTVLETAAVGATMEIGLQFYSWHPGYAGGGRQYEFDADYGALTLEILPPFAPPGDFDDDGDVDTDDIDDLCANMTGDGVPLPGGSEAYDLDGDGDADSADMDILIHDLVEIAGGGTGTEYGDFDLDGDVDTTDLTILATNFGLGTTWAEGNANCDTVINTTDLTILATNFGFVAAGAVPEPATMSLLALGSLAMLRRRRK